jgi:drug/metabolite transporter (DMT)-like permease
MTNSTDKADWPQAIGCYFGGAALSVVLGQIAMSIDQDFVTAGVGFQLFVAVLAAVSVVVARRLPRRARALFVVGVLTPVVVVLLFLVWLLATFTQNFTF